MRSIKTLVIWSAIISLGAIGFIVWTISGHAGTTNQPIHTYVDAQGRSHTTPVHSDTKSTQPKSTQSTSTPAKSTQAEPIVSRQTALQDLWKTSPFPQWQVAVYDEQTQDITSISNTDQPMTLASVIKVGILASVLQQQTTLTSTNQSLADDMMQHSDNDSAQTLYDQVGSAGLQQTYKAFGLTNTTVNTQHWGWTTSTATDQVTLLTHIFLPKQAQLTADQQTIIQSEMLAVDRHQKWGVGKMTQNTAVKNGWLPDDDDPNSWSLNSIGHVVDGQNAYDVAILTHGQTFDNGTQQLTDYAQQTMHILEETKP